MHLLYGERKACETPGKIGDQHNVSAIDLSGIELHRLKPIAGTWRCEGAAAQCSHISVEENRSTFHNPFRIGWNACSNTAVGTQDARIGG